MADWPSTSGARIGVIGDNPATSFAVSVLTPGTTHTKGAWTQISAATPFGCAGFSLTLNPSQAAFLVDIAVGASGSEQILVPDIHIATLSGNPWSGFFPVSIPAGVRVAARVQASVLSTDVGTSMYLMSTGFDRPVPRSRVLAYGVNTATSRGTSVDPGSAVNTKGSWVQLTSSTTATLKELMLSVGNQNNTAPSSSTWLVDVGVGASGSEQILISNWRITSTISRTISPQVSWPFPVSIPQGSRLAVRSQSNTNDATDRLLDFAIHGVA